VGKYTVAGKPVGYAPAQPPRPRRVFVVGLKQRVPEFSTDFGTSAFAELLLSLMKTESRLHRCRPS